MSAIECDFCATPTEHGSVICCETCYERLRVKRRHESLTAALREYHLNRHKMLHANLDELWADYIAHHTEHLSEWVNVRQLLRWAHEQANNPTPPPLLKDRL